LMGRVLARGAKRVDFSPLRPARTHLLQ